MTAVRMWVAGPPPSEVRLSLERLSRHPGVVGVAAMPDVHLAHDVCVGTVLATQGLIYPAAIGGDIGCGVSAMRFEGPASAVLQRSRQMLEGLRERIPIVRLRAPRDLPEELTDMARGRALSRAAGRDGPWQFGTVGRGNHFVELLGDGSGSLWVLVHSGSRGMGPYVQRLHAQGNGLVALDPESVQGLAFLIDQDWAMAYARLSREEMVATAGALVMSLLGFDPVVDSYLDTTHNMVRSELIEGQRLWIHRKGAISARPGELGIIPGSMATPTFLVEGRGHAAAYHSSSHGAGRRLSRTEARRAIGLRQFRRETRDVLIHGAVAASLVEEAPSAYKDIRSVMRAQRELTKVVGELTPVLNHKGG
jgi:tRNA-splicing ligase RtcB (3'-phosphate/5'-hydroxy nucleic acid ligase)